MNFDRLSIFVHRQQAFYFLLLATGCFLIYAGALVFYWSTLPVGSRALLIGFGVLMSSFLFYGLRLLIEKGPVLHMEPAGVFDGASFFEMGIIRRAELKSLAISEIFGVYFVVIHLSPQAHAIRRKSVVSSPLFSLFRIITGDRIWIPYAFLNIPFFQLASFVRKFSLNLHPVAKVMDNVAEYGSARRATMERRIKEVSAKLDRGGVSLSAARDSSSKFFKPSDPDTWAPIVVGQEIKVTERDRVLGEIRAIKEEVIHSGVATLLIELFWDYARHFSEWYREGDLRLPREVQNISSNSSAEESVSFHYNRRDYKLRFKRFDKDPSAGVFVIYVDDEIQCLFEVKSGITMLEVEDIKTFITGPWVDDLISLARRLKQVALAQLSNPGTLIPEETEVTHTTQLQDLEELKRKFGLG